jgi:hypothetical protein
MATERGGFEPPLGFPKTHFECVTINHSDTSPKKLVAQTILTYRSQEFKEEERFKFNRLISS